VCLLYNYIIHICSSKEMVFLLSMSFFFFLFCFLFLMMLMEGEPTGSHCSYCCNFFFYLVPVSILWVFLWLMLLILYQTNFKKKSQNQLLSNFQFWFQKMNTENSMSIYSVAYNVICPTNVQAHLNGPIKIECYISIYFFWSNSQ